MRITASKIIEDFAEQQIFDEVIGEERPVTGIASVDCCGEGDLVFVDQESFMQRAVQSGPSLIVTTMLLAKKYKGCCRSAFLVSQNVRLAQALLRQTYADRNLRANGWGDQHESAVIHDSAIVGNDASIGPGVVISRDVKIGSGVVVMANTVIEEGAEVGDGTVIHANTVIGYNCVVGKNCIIKSGTVIGMEGFGFAQDKKGKSHRIPHLGNVVIGDEVVIGANCNIDRAVFQSTRIANGCKLDALCHIAHNVEIGEDCLLAAQTCVAGSTRIGNRVMCSGQTGILDHLDITDDVALTQRAGVIKSIDQPGVYAGHPVQPVRKYFKNVALLNKLSDTIGRLKLQ